MPRLEQLKVMFLELDTDGSGWTKDQCLHLCKSQSTWLSHVGVLCYPVGVEWNFGALCTLCAPTGQTGQANLARPTALAQFWPKRTLQRSKSRVISYKLQQSNLIKPPRATLLPNHNDGKHQPKSSPFGHTSGSSWVTWSMCVHVKFVSTYGHTWTK